MCAFNRDWSRRAFLKSGAVVPGAGWPLQPAWSTEGADQGVLKMVFIADVHARTEYDTPSALARAAEAINAQQPDLILAGGDLITDGFQAMQGSVDDRLVAYFEMHHVCGATFTRRLAARRRAISGHRSANTWGVAHLSLF
jgi:3',5'-cyclic AMP phosphodiesterase CpdA